MALTKQAGALAAGYYVYLDAGTLRFVISDGTIEAGDAQTPYVASGSAHVSAGVRAIASDDLRAYEDGVSTAATTDTTTGSLANATTLRIGQRGGAIFLNAEFFGAAIHRLALTPAQVAALDAEFGANV
jgi:hypothetical protein